MPSILGGIKERKSMVILSDISLVSNIYCVYIYIFGLFGLVV